MWGGTCTVGNTAHCYCPECSCLPNRACKIIIELASTILHVTFILWVLLGWFVFLPMAMCSVSRSRILEFANGLTWGLRNCWPLFFHTCYFMQRYTALCNKESKNFRVQNRLVVNCAYLNKTNIAVSAKWLSRQRRVPHRTGHLSLRCGTHNGRWEMTARELSSDHIQWHIYLPPHTN